MLPHRKNPQVIVAGAGPVGLFTALCLARQGAHVRIVDEAWRTAQHSYSLALHPASLGLLHELGLFERVVERSLRVERVAFYDETHRRAELDLSQLYGSPGFLAVTRQDVFEDLLERALRKEGIRVDWNHRVSSISPRDGAVEVTLDRLVKESLGYAVAHTEWLVGASRELDVSFVVGADGHRSILRRQQGIDFPEVGPVEHFAVYEFEVEKPLPPEVRVVLTDETTSVLWPLPGNRGRWSFQIGRRHPVLGGRGKQRTVVDVGSMLFPELDRPSLSRLIEARAPWFTADVGAIDWRMAVRFERRLADRFGAGRLWLVGDSAHVTGPVGVQSMNVGLREGRDLADTLSDYLESGGALDRREQYDTERRDEWRMLLDLDHSLRGREKTDPWVRDRASRMLGCLPGSGETLDAMLQQLAARPVLAADSVSTDDRRFTLHALKRRRDPHMIAGHARRLPASL